MTYRAKNANLVLADEGSVTVLTDGKQTKTLQVRGAPPSTGSPTTRPPDRPVSNSA
ncbi:hypothetical protein OG906_01295 [Streptomyces sp. NBC_01426]|uniref:hypothetical protein n=1 Tax=Streptomyces sp. NBC_01426 TaxID=2975866 RepID=UPI002E330035|nr:hypothetical protein [Streptomyces sp. NBC_01426]